MNPISVLGLVVTGITIAVMVILKVHATTSRISLHISPWKCDEKNLAIAMAAVKRMKSKEKLMRMALLSKCLDVRVAAVEKITDQKHLVRIAVHGEGDDIREKAMSKITNPELRKEVEDSFAWRSAKANQATQTVEKP